MFYWKKDLSNLVMTTLYFSKHSDNTFLALLVYVENIIIASNNYNAIETLKTTLSKQFKMKDLSPLKYFLGLGVARSAAGMSTKICT